MYLGNSHVDATVVLADIKIEILAIHAHVTALRQVAFEATVVGAEFFEKVRQRVAKLYHTLSRYCDLRSGTSPCYRLRHLKEVTGANIIGDPPRNQTIRYTVCAFITRRSLHRIPRV